MLQQFSVTSREDAGRGRPARGLPAWTYRNPELLGLEYERVILPSWQFVCHQNQLREPGDFATLELMRDPETGGPHTAHTTNPVPLLLVGARNRGLVADGRLADLAPTLLELMELPKPVEMTGTSLLAG